MEAASWTAAPRDSCCITAFGFAEIRCSPCLPSQSFIIIFIIIFIIRATWAAMASMQFFQLLQAEFPALVVFALLLTFVTFIATTYFPRLNRKSRGIHIPYVGHRRGPWLDIKTKSRWITASEELLKEGWDQVHQGEEGKWRALSYHANPIFSMEAPLFEF